MVQSTELTLESVQVTGFVAGDDLRPKLALANALQNLSDVYDGETVSLPLPPEAPPDFPAVLLSNSLRTQQVQIARSRITLVHRPHADEATDLRGILGTLAGRLGALLDGTEARLGRLGMVVVRQASVERPGDILSRQYCRDEWLRTAMNRPEGFELHAHKTFDLMPGVSVNSWIRVRTGKSRGDAYDSIVTEQDINTLVEELQTRQFSGEQTSQIAEAAANQFDVILQLYFPQTAGREET